MAKNHHKSPAPVRERFATIAADCYPPLKSDDSYCQPLRPIPWLRLRGHWLQQAGFGIDQKIRIKVEKNKLVITAE